MVDDVDHTLECCAINDDSWQSEDRPRRIIGMQRHAHAGRSCNRNDAFQEIRKVLPELVLVHRAIRIDKLSQIVCSVSASPTGKLSGAPRETHLCYPLIAAAQRGRSTL